MSDYLARLIEQMITTLIREYYRNHATLILWQALALDGKFDVIETLHLIERGDINFIIVKPEGFSKRDDIHNMVINWCRVRGVNIVNVGAFVARLENAQSWKRLDPLFNAHNEVQRD